MNWHSDQISRLIALALEEDLGIGDATADALMTGSVQGNAAIVARQSLIVCGTPLIGAIIAHSGRDVSVTDLVADGTEVVDTTVIARLHGRYQDIVSLERTVLNFLQRLSGVATHTRNFVDRARGVTVLDTRKTTPGWRLLEKYAVTVGGAKNHRMNLGDMILVKNNHIDAFAGDIRKLGILLKNRKSPYVPVEVEVRDLHELASVITHINPPLIMLDNMSLDTIRDAVAYIRKHAPHAAIEISGGVTPERCEALAEIDAHLFVSAGSLTTQATNVDISLRIVAQ